MPIAWVREFKNTGTTPNRIVTTTMGSASDFKCADLRRLVINATYWTTGLADKIPAKAKVDFVTPFDPTFYGFNSGRKGVKPADHALPH